VAVAGTAALLAIIAASIAAAAVVGAEAATTAAAAAWACAATAAVTGCPTERAPGCSDACCRALQQQALLQRVLVESLPYGRSPLMHALRVLLCCMYAAGPLLMKAHMLWLGPAGSSCK